MMPTRLMIHPLMPERRVNRGFNWGALIFGTMWAYSEGLIAQGGRLIAIDAAVSLLGTRGHAALLIPALLLLVAKNGYCACKGNNWVYRDLQRQGYRAIQ
ncbi:hypothetical protein WI36_14825 [Burkholderia ubonensis]|nr:hypothetical protein WI36_14825 [Burkholderia ubonensis]